jgi:uncharacterized protein
MSQKTTDIESLESILSYIVSKPEAIEITRKVDEMGVLLILKVDRSDMGIVIGRNGEMANAIKKYIKKVGQVNNMNIRLRIDEPQGTENEESSEINNPEKSNTSNTVDEAPLEIEEQKPKEVIAPPTPKPTSIDLEDFSLN